MSWSFRENWRIVMLVVFLAASTLALFGPVGPGAAQETTTEFVTLSGDSNTLEVSDTSLVVENGTLETTNGTENTITATDATLNVDGDISNVANTSASVANGTITVNGGTVVAPSNTTGITTFNSSVNIDSGTVTARDSNVTVTVERNRSSGVTNLQYGLDLSGGTRIRAPLVGSHVTDVTVSSEESFAFGRDLAAELGVDPIDVNTRMTAESTATVEVYANVSNEEFAGALRTVGADVQASDVQDGVTKQTRDTVVNTLSQKIDRTGLSGGTVSTVATQSGPPYVVVEVPNARPDEVRDIVSSRGVVQIIAEVREGNTTTNTTVLTSDNIDSVGAVGPRQNTDSWEVPVTVSGGYADDFEQQMQELGFTSGAGVGNCDRKTGQGLSGSYCLLTVLDGEIVQSNGMGRNLASSLENGEWSLSPTFTIGASEQPEAQEVKISLDVGSLPTNLDLSRDAEYDISYLQPSLAERFKSLALVTGLLTWLAVSGVVFLRYRSLAVAVPMLLTAMAEVFILLGFVSVTGLALNLSHIAGLIAVIGTGVDDLIIIGDEILQEGEVATGRVFQNRFRKAFWVIGAAAATTIIAMSPLTFLSVGDLFGFAVVTIVGVLIGVIVTRPAYGDILRHLVLSEQNN